MDDPGENEQIQIGKNFHTFCARGEPVAKLDYANLEKAASRQRNTRRERSPSVNRYVREANEKHYARDSPRGSRTRKLKAPDAKQ